MLLATGGAAAQEPVAAAAPKLAFEVASVKPAPPMDMQKLAAAMRGGGKLPVGATIGASRAEYTGLPLNQLIAMAYKVKPYQITGPDWMTAQRFDIVAKYPEGATKADAPKMLQALLEERFKLTLHRETKEHPVLALVVGKGGSKLKDSGSVPQPIDEDSPLKPGEMSTDTGEGQVRMTVDAKTGGAAVDMGAKGKFTYKVDPGTMTMHMEGSQVTMAGFAELLTQLSQMTGGSTKTVVDMTDLKGNYEVAIDFSLADLIAMARAQGVDIPAGVGGATAGVPAGATAASEPGGGTSLTQAVAALGLKLDPRKAQIEQLVIDHIEKTPTEN